MYSWHDKHYLGAAHGLSGIFYMLLQVKRSLVSKIIYNGYNEKEVCVDFIINDFHNQ